MGVLKTFLRNWVAFAAAGVIIVFLLLFFLISYNRYSRFYHIKAAEKLDAEKRVDVICSNATNVKLINYGARCRLYEHESKIDVGAEALEAVAASYGLDVIILYIIIFVLVLVLIVLCKYMWRYPRYIDAMNVDIDMAFYNNPRVSLYSNRVPHFTPAIRHNDSDPFKEA
jgi:hypothetical protein